ncbi:MAG TPA: DUF2059 domain-containing protein [Thermoanaerobaculia bacterium]
MTLLLSLAGMALGQGPAPASSHEQAARELYRLLGGEKLAQAGAEAMMGVIRGNPDLAPYEDVFRAWYKKVFADGNLEPEMVKIYMGAFTEDELRQMTAFYRSPVGQKSLAKMPEVLKQGADVGIKLGQQHIGELQEMIEAAKKEREKNPSPNP